MQQISPFVGKAINPGAFTLFLNFAESQILIFDLLLYLIKCFMFKNNIMKNRIIRKMLCQEKGKSEVCDHGNKQYCTNEQGTVDRHS